MHTELLMAMLPGGHRLAARRRITIADLGQDRFISCPAGATIREAVERAAGAAGYIPHTSIETNDVSRTAALIAEGLGVAVLAETHARRGGADAVGVPLHAPTLRYEIHVAMRANRHLAPPAAAVQAAFLEVGDPPTKRSR
jgi:DNA-binding transcriptional LysR family regulator